jgi:hypothetical protein
LEFLDQMCKQLWQVTPGRGEGMLGV